MVVPISGNQNYLPVDRGKRITVRESEKVSFEEFLLEKIEPSEESAHSSEENKGFEQGKKKKTESDTSEITEEMIDRSNTKGSDHDATFGCSKCYYQGNLSDLQ